jgi:hypothetical protein
LPVPSAAEVAGQELHGTADDLGGGERQGDMSQSDIGAPLVARVLILGAVVHRLLDLEEPVGIGDCERPGLPSPSPEHHDLTNVLSLDCDRVELIEKQLSPRPPLERASSTQAADVTRLRV